MANFNLLPLVAVTFPLPGVGEIPEDCPADQPVERTDPASRIAHRHLLAKTRQGKIDVYFLGDSLTRRWGATDHPHLLAHWKQCFHGWNAANFGWGGDKTQHVLWRLQNGELDGISPKVISLQVGTNNLEPPMNEAKANDIVRGIKAILNLCRKKAPEALIVLTAVFPRNDDLGLLPAINLINREIVAFADGRKIRWININDQLADKNGILYAGMVNAEDKLHLELKAYEIWFEALKPVFTELLGPPAAVDLAPPPTGKSDLK